MKKQRKNTISKEAVKNELPIDEKREPRAKRPGDFDKKPRPSRKPRKENEREDFKTTDRKVSRAPREEGADGKPKRRNTKSREEISKREDSGRDRKPRYEKKEGGGFKNDDRKPKFEKRESGYKSDDRKPRFEKKDSADRKSPAKNSKDYFSSFAEKNRKKRKEDFKVKKEEGDNVRPTTNNRKDEYKPNRTNTGKRTFKDKYVEPKKQYTEKELVEEQMPLNKFISRAGYCSRREAAELIKAGEVKVNGVVLKEPGYKVLETDVVTYQDNDVTKKEKQVYFLLNKAKDYITTTDDPEGRKTVMDLFKDVKERIFPVGRLDRNTTGLLLLTNDGHLAQKLSHPKFKSKKVYQVKLDKNLEPDHFDEIVKGLKLEDGIATVDSLAYINPENKSEIGIEIHIGKNRIVRRIFEHLGYEVKNLDRVMYAGLTKKNLPRGKWRALTEKELVFLKHFK